MIACRAKSGPAVGVLVVLVLVLAACSTDTAKPTATPATGAKAGGNAGADARPFAFREPVKLSSRDGVLEVRLSAHQGSVALDTVATPVSNFLVYGYEVIRGTASDGSTTGDNLYPAPTLRVDPGERLLVHYDNDLVDLTIQDYYDPAFTPVGAEVPLYPPALTSSPLNLHTHGLHVSPGGNADNVLLDIPAGEGNVYDYAVPKDMPNGMYWYHSHRHTLTAQQTYLGLSGLLEIGRPDGNLPVVTQNDIPIRDMALQYNYVFDRKGSGHQLNDVNWPQYVSTLNPPQGSQLADGTYVPKLTPVNFEQTSKDAQFFTNWYAGPLSVSNNRGQNQFVPSNLQSFTTATPAPTSGAAPGSAVPATSAPATSAPATTASATSGSGSGSGGVVIPANPALPDNQRDVQFTVNGQFQPALELQPGQTEIWVLANISDFAYLSLTLTETATGNHPKILLVGQDGNPFPEVHLPVGGDGTRLVMPPGARYAIAVTMPQQGDLVLEMPPMAGAQPVTSPGVLYTNNGTPNPPAVLGTVNVDPSVISYTDGFFTFPTQQLIRARAASGTGRTTAFTPGQPLGAYTSFVDTAAMNPDVTRTLVIGGGFGNTLASPNDPKAFTYEFDATIFPNVPLIQPRLNSVEEWRIDNTNNDEHPMHIHVNDFQVMQIVDPVRGTTGVQMWGEDNVNVPAPVLDANGNVTGPASVTLRTKFTGYTGTYVIHCHRLNHEDNGLMAIVNVIPQVSSYAVAVPGAAGQPATVQVLDADGDKLLRTVTPFPGFEGTPSVAMADVNGDMVLDLVAGTGAGAAPQVVAYDGATATPFAAELTRFAPFADDVRGGVSVAGADVDGNALADNIIVGTGPGTPTQVKVFSTTLSTTGQAPAAFSTFTPYADSTAGVTLATGLVDATSGRQTIVTAPGPGVPAQIKTWRFDLFTPTAAAARATTTGSSAPGTTDVHAAHDPTVPTLTADFAAFDSSYLGGASLSTGWVAGAEGGAKSIVTGMLGGDGTVRVWSSGSQLEGSPPIYLQSPDHHAGPITFNQIASFAPFADAPSGSGVRVATTSTTSGADLIVSGTGPSGTTEVRLYGLARPNQTATTVSPTLLRQLPALTGSAAFPLAGR